MIITINCMGKICPIPVIEAKNALETANVGDVLEVQVDNRIAVENLMKLAEQKGLKAIEKAVIKDGYIISIEKTMLYEKKQLDNEAMEETTIVVIGSDKMGEGDERLGKTLIKGFIYALSEQNKLPAAMLFYNNGAKITTKGSESISDLISLEERGVKILTCGTCLDFYGLSNKLCVGSTTNMYTILEIQMNAAKILKL